MKNHFTNQGLQPSRRINHFNGDRLSDLFRVEVAGQEMPVTVLPGLDVPACKELSEYYQGMHHPNMRLAARDMTYHVVHSVLGSAADCSVCVRVPERIVSFAVYPQRKKIEARAEDRELQFTWREDVPYTIVEIDELPVLCLILETDAEDERLSVPSGAVNFAEYAARLAEGDDHTAAFRQAIRDVNGTGGTLHIPPGVYQTESLLLHQCRDCNLYFAEGALVNMAVSPPGENIRTPGIWMHECDNVTILGRGCIDQRSYENFHSGRNDYAHGFRSDSHYQSLQPLSPDDPLLMSPLLITNSQDIHVQDITLRNGKVWNINVKNSRQLRFSHCKVITPPASNPEWTDGFNFGGCRDVWIDDCFMAVNDDCFAGAHYVSPYDRDDGGNFHVRGLVGYNPRAQGIRLGWACNRAQGSYRFENCDFIGKCEILIHPVQGEPGERLGYEAVRFIDCGCDKFPDIGIEGVMIKQLEFTNVTFSSPFLRGKGRIAGHPEKPIELLWRNTRVAGILTTPAECLHTEYVTHT